MGSPLTAVAATTAKTFAILPDVLAYHVCPFLGNRDRASMLQLCQGVRRDLVARKVSGLVRYILGFNGYNMSDAEIAAQFAYMQQHGTQRLTVISHVNTFAPMIQCLDKLRELRYIENSNSIHPPDSKNMPPSLEILRISFVHNYRNTSTINLAHLPNLRSLEVYATEAVMKLAAENPPPFFADLRMHVYSLSTTRADAAHIMLGPNLTHFDMYTKMTVASESAVDINDVFDGLEAPALQSFSSRGSWVPHTYNLRTPQLRVVHHGMFSCIPKNAPNVTHIHTTYYNVAKYTHLTKLTHLYIEMQPWTLVHYIDDLPPQLEELCISGAHIVVNVSCALPKMLKLIRLLKGCKLGRLPEYIGEIVSTS
jgi:hypothetical protein